MSFSPSTKIQSQLQSLVDSISIGRKQGKLGKSLAVTSCRRAEGKSTLVHAMAEVLGEFGQRVLVVSAASGDALPEEVSLFDWLNSDPAEWDRLIAEQLEEQQFIRLPLARRGQSGAELLESKMGQSLAHLEEQFDYVFFDLSDYHSSRIAGIVVSQVKNTLLVLEHLKTGAQELQQVSRQIQSDGGSLFAVILNKHRCIVPNWTN